MAANRIKGLTVSINGETTGLNKALSGVNQKSKDLQSELREVERLLKLDPTNTELLSQKQKLLADSVANTKEKLDTLKTSAEQAQDQLERGELSQEQFNALQREIIKTEQNLESLERQSKDFGSTFSQQIKKAGEDMQDFGDKVSGAGQKMLPGTVAIVGAGAAAMKFAADAEDAAGATDQIFGNAAEGMKTWANELESFYGISSAEALTYGNTMGSMLQNIGNLTKEEAASQSQTLIKLAGDLAAMYGGTTEDAVRALTGALKGNNTMLDNYGMAANDALIKTKAFEMGIYDGKGEMELATKQAATLALVMEQSGAAQGQAARESEGASGSMRAFAADTKDLAASFGEVLLPTITPLIQKVTGLIQRLGDLDTGTRTVIITILGIVAAIGPVLIVVGKLITAVGTILTILPKVRAAILAVNAALAANPILAVIAIIALLVGALITLWVTNEDFRNKVIEIWDTIKEKVGSAIGAIKDFFTVTIPKAIDEMVSFFANLPGRIWEKLLEAIAKVKQWGEDIKTWAKEHLPAPIATIVGFFAELPGKLLQVGKDLIEGLWGGISEKAAWIKGKVTGFVDTIKGWFTGKDGFDSHSPSRWGEGEGGNVGVGFANGLLAVKDKAVSAAQAVADATKKVFDGIEYNPSIDYSELIASARKAGDLEKQAELERARNAKIDGEGLSWAKTFDFAALANAVTTLAENASYAVTPTTAAPERSQEEVVTEMYDRVSQMVAQALLNGLAQISDTIFDAIPKQATFELDGQQMARVSWGAYDGEGNRRGRIYAPSRDEIARIAMSVMPKI